MISKASFKVVLLLAMLFVLGFSGTARAQSIIKQPNNHPDYGFELEPHLSFQWGGGPWGDYDSFGPGARFNIPILKNGFIPKLNNSVAIGFGLDVTFGSYRWCGGRNYYVNGYDCSVTEFWLPAVLQWNFWLTKVVSVFGEPGFAIVHTRWSNAYWYCNGQNQPACADYHDSHTGFEPVFSAGGRFMFSDTFGATVRIGYPMLSAGLNILL